MTECALNEKPTTDSAINSFETLKGSYHIPEIIRMIKLKGIPDSEGFSMLVVGILIACAATNDSHNLYFKVLPTVNGDGTDQRKNKYTDYLLLKMYNKRTYVVVELKKEATVAVQSIDQEHLAQLVDEIYLVQSEEGLSCYLINDLSTTQKSTRYNNNIMHFISPS